MIASFLGLVLVTAQNLTVTIIANTPSSDPENSLENIRLSSRWVMRTSGYHQDWTYHQKSRRYFSIISQTINHEGIGYRMKAYHYILITLKGEHDLWLHHDGAMVHGELVPHGYRVAPEPTEPHGGILSGPQGSTEAGCVEGLHHEALHGDCMRHERAERYTLVGKFKNTHHIYLYRSIQFYHAVINCSRKL